MSYLSELTTSDVQTADVQIVAVASLLFAVDLATPASASTTLKIYDSENSTLTGKKLVAELVCQTGTNSVHLVNVHPIRCSRGIYVDLVGTSADFIVKYSLS